MVGGPGSGPRSDGRPTVAPIEPARVSAVVEGVLGAAAAEAILTASGWAGPGPDAVQSVPPSQPSQPSQVSRPLPGPVAPDVGRRVPRAEVALALHVVLLADLCERVPSARAYVEDSVAAGRPVVLDHAAVRTVAWPCGDLPPGIEQVSRLIEPLGYERHATYPLERIGMTGHAFAHVDHPEVVPQWFVSELHPDRLSPVARTVVTEVLAGSSDPLDEATGARLAALAATGDLSSPDAVALVGALRRCFDRQHPLPTDRDYDLLRSESPEMAWIATEGTACNHCTDRVDDVEAVARTERERGRPIKDAVEVSASGRVRQTAHRAATVVRRLATVEGDVVEREVPGSFFEVISRDRLPDGTLDLAFDAANATGIFAMTRAPQDRPPPPAPSS